MTTQVAHTKAQHTTTVRRVMLLLPQVEICSLPGGGAWTPGYMGGNGYDWKIDISGRDLGGYRRGRIVIRGARKWRTGDIVRCRVMQTTHMRPHKWQTYEFLVLEAVEEDQATDTIPKLSWNIAACHISVFRSKEIDIESSAFWYQTVECEKWDEDAYELGILSITTTDRPLVVSSYGGASEHLYID